MHLIALFVTVLGATQDQASPPTVAESRAPIAQPQAHCENLDEIVATLARMREEDDDDELVARLDELVDRHAARHGWAGGIRGADLVVPERAAGCDPKFLEEIPAAFRGELRLERLTNTSRKLYIAPKLLKVLERNRRSSAAIEFANETLSTIKEQLAARPVARAMPQRGLRNALPDIYFRQGDWLLAATGYDGWSVAIDTNYSVYASHQTRDHMRCRCLLELGSYEAVISIARDHLNDTDTSFDAWIDYHVSFGDDLALAELLSGDRAAAVASLASIRERARGQYAMDVDTLERCWKALRGQPVEIGAAELASCSIDGCTELATELLIRGGPESVAPFLGVFARTDESIATRQLRDVLLDTGYLAVRDAVIAAYDATDSEQLRNKLDSIIGRWRTALTLRVTLEQP